jgi:hypothetical protein
MATTAMKGAIGDPGAELTGTFHVRSDASGSAPLRTEAPALTAA